MAIIYQKNKSTGKTYAFESRSYWVPELGQPRSERTYLGVVDPETGTIIPSSGKRGRKPGTKVKKKPESDTENYTEIIAEKDREISDLKAEIKWLKKVLMQISEAASKVLQ